MDKNLDLSSLTQSELISAMNNAITNKEIENISKIAAYSQYKDAKEFFEHHLYSIALTRDKEVNIAVAEEANKILLNEENKISRLTHEELKQAMDKAINEGEINIINKIIDCGIDLNESKEWYNNYLVRAAYKGNVQVVAALLEGGAKVLNLDPFFKAIYLENFSDGLEIVKLLLSEKPVLEEEGKSILYAATAYGKYEICKELIKAGADINVIIDSKTPIIKAAINGYKEIVELLLRAGANKNLPACLILNDLESIKTLDDKEIENNPISLFCSFKHKTDKPLFKLLLDYIKDFNKTCPETQLTPLLSVIHADSKDNDKTELIKLLIEKGADVNYKSLINGITPLIACIWKSNTKIFKLLIEKGANVHHIDNMGNNMIHHLFFYKHNRCTDSNYKEMLDLLLELKIDINAKNHSGNTPIHIAIKNEHCRDNIKHLVEKGSKIDVYNYYNETPLNLAVDNEYIVSYFLEKGVIVDLLSGIYVYQNDEDKIIKIIDKTKDINIRDSLGYSALHHTIELGLYKTIVIYKEVCARKKATMVW